MQDSDTYNPQFPPWYNGDSSPQHTDASNWPMVSSYVESASLPLRGTVALVTIGDTEVGRQIAITLANHGADVAIVYSADSPHIAAIDGQITNSGSRCIPILCQPGDDTSPESAIRRTRTELGRVDIVISQHVDAESAQVFDPASLSASLGTGVRPTGITEWSTVNGLDPLAVKGAVATFTHLLAETLEMRSTRAYGDIKEPLMPRVMPSTEQWQSLDTSLHA